MKVFLGAWGMALLIVATFVLGIPQSVFGARSQYGMTGIYNASPLSLSNGEGVGLAVDSQGHLIISTTTPVSVSFPLTQTTIPYVSSTAITATNFYGNGSHLTGVSSVNDWGTFGITYGALSLTPSSTMPVWIKNNEAVSGTVYATEFRGSGANLTNLPAIAAANYGNEPYQIGNGFSSSTINATATSTFFSGVQATHLYTSNGLTVVGGLILPNNSVTDAMLSDAITLSGGTISSNNISGTLTTTGSLTIGDNGDNIIIDANNWDVSSAGVATFAGLSTSTLDNIVIGGSTRAAGNFTNFDFNGIGTIGDGGDAIAVNSNTWDISSAGVATSLSLSTSTLDGMTIGASTASTGRFTTLNVTGNSTSTFANGIQITKGCFLMPNGTCAGAGSSGANTALSNLSAVAINLSLLPGSNNSIDLGAYGTSLRNEYVSSTIYLGNSSGLTTLTGGAAGVSTSTFAGDVDIANLYSGTPTFPNDAGIVDLWTNPVSSSAASGTIEAINFTSDGLAWARIESLSDGAGSVNNKRFVIHDEQGMATTSIRQSRNTATSTPLSDEKVSVLGGRGSCIPLTAYTGGTLYLSVGNVNGTPTLSVSSSTCMAADQLDNQ